MGKGGASRDITWFVPLSVPRARRNTETITNHGLNPRFFPSRVLRDRGPWKGTEDHGRGKQGGLSVYGGLSRLASHPPWG